MAPRNDSGILKDRKNQMMTVWGSVVGERCLRRLLSEKEDPPTWLDSLFEHPGKEAVVLIDVANNDTRLCKLNLDPRTCC